MNSKIKFLAVSGIIFSTLLQAGCSKPSDEQIKLQKQTENRISVLETKIDKLQVALAETSKKLAQNNNLENESRLTAAEDAARGQDRADEAYRKANSVADDLQKFKDSK